MLSLAQKLNILNLIIDGEIIADPNVEVIFLPAYTTSLIQPLNQTVIATFKSYYLRRVMNKILPAVNHHKWLEKLKGRFLLTCRRQKSLP